MSKGNQRTAREIAMMEELRSPDTGGVRLQTPVPHVAIQASNVPVVTRAKALSVQEEDFYTGVIVKMLGWYGFIEQDSLPPGKVNNAYFVTRGAQWKTGQRVTYRRTNGERGYVATNVRLIP